MTEHLHLGVALDGYGWHPEAWRYTSDGEPNTSGRYWSGLATTAERGLLDFVTFDDALTRSGVDVPRSNHVGRQDDSTPYSPHPGWRP